MELLAVLNEWSGGLIAALIVGAITGWWKQQRTLNDLRSDTQVMREQYRATKERLDDPTIGVVPRIEFQLHKDATGHRLGRLERHVLRTPRSGDPGVTGSEG